MKIPSWFSGDLHTAARVWAAAAGTAGALASRHIADALIEGYGLCDAAIEGTRRAAEGVEEGWPPPRGCEIQVNQGQATLAWITERHHIFLSRDPISDEDWLVTIHCYHDETPGGCERVQAAERAQMIEPYTLLRQDPETGEEFEIPLKVEIDFLRFGSVYGPQSMDNPSEIILGEIWRADTGERFALTADELDLIEYDLFERLWSERRR